MGQMTEANTQMLCRRFGKIKRYVRREGSRAKGEVFEGVEEQERGRRLKEEGCRVSVSVPGTVWPG